MRITFWTVWLPAQFRRVSASRVSSLAQEISGTPKYGDLVHSHSSHRRGVRQNVTELVNDFLPDFIFEKIVIARRAQHSGFQDFVLLMKQLIEFESQFLATMVCHKSLS